MRPIAPDFSYQAICEDCLVLHRDIITALHDQLNAPDTVKSHFFNGRYENIYIRAEKITGLKTILDHLRRQAAQLLQIPVTQLRLGFWFNLMARSDVTTTHSHDDDDELLSGTYYLQMPPESGQLLLHHPPTSTTIQPSEGRCILFHPAVDHEVTVHQSGIMRISLGFNIGLLK